LARASGVSSICGGGWVAEEVSEISADKLVPDVLVTGVEGMLGMDTTRLVEIDPVAEAELISVESVFDIDDMRLDETALIVGPELMSVESVFDIDDRRVVEPDIVTEAELTSVEFVPTIEIEVTSVEFMPVIDDAEIVEFRPTNEEELTSVETVPGTDDGKDIEMGPVAEAELFPGMLRTGDGISTEDVGIVEFSPLRSQGMGRSQISTQPKLPRLCSAMIWEANEV
jgi:hypothetical protein